VTVDSRDLHVASTCWPKRSPSRNHECLGSPALPADLKFPAINMPHGSTPIGSSRHNAKQAQVQARCSPREDDVEKVEEGFEPPASDTAQYHIFTSSPVRDGAGLLLGTRGTPGSTQAPCGGELGAVAVRIGPRREALNPRQIPPEGSTRSDAESADDVIVPGDRMKVIRSQHGRRLATRG